jgi:hypothetical protein
MPKSKQDLIEQTIKAKLNGLLPIENYVGLYDLQTLVLLLNKLDAAYVARVKEIFDPARKFGSALQNFIQACQDSELAKRILKQTVNSLLNNKPIALADIPEKAKPHLNEIVKYINNCARKEKLKPVDVERDRRELAVIFSLFTQTQIETTAVNLEKLAAALVVTPELTAVSEPSVLNVTFNQAPIEQQKLAMVAPVQNVLAAYPITPVLKRELVEAPSVMSEQAITLELPPLTAVESEPVMTVIPKNNDRKIQLLEQLKELVHLRPDLDAGRELTLADIPDEETYEYQALMAQMEEIEQEIKFQDQTEESILTVDFDAEHTMPNYVSRGYEVEADQAFALQLQLDEIRLLALDTRQTQMTVFMLSMVVSMAHQMTGILIQSIQYQQMMQTGASQLAAEQFGMFAETYQQMQAAAHVQKQPSSINPVNFIEFVP